MVVGTYEITHDRILESGRTMFLEHGYERTNLRALCRNAGITTGAFYRHFEDKASLFAALVEPAIRGLDHLYDEAVSRQFDLMDVRTFDELFSVSREAIVPFIRYLFENFDTFKLILACADGTKYVHFTDEMVEREVGETLAMYEALAENGVAFQRLSEKELHMLYHSFFSCIFETILHDYTEEEALACAQTLARFFTAGWRETHGL